MTPVRIQRKRIDPGSRPAPVVDLPAFEGTPDMSDAAIAARVIALVDEKLATLRGERGLVALFAALGKQARSEGAEQVGLAWFCAAEFARRDFVVEGTPPAQEKKQRWARELAENLDFAIDLTESRETLLGRFEALIVANCDMPRQALIEEAARSLVEKLHATHAHPRFAMVWQMAQLHVGPYDGPTYTAELQALEAALAVCAPQGQTDAEKELALLREAAADQSLSDGAVRSMLTGRAEEPTADDIAWAKGELSRAPEDPR